MRVVGIQSASQWRKGQAELLVESRQNEMLATTERQAERVWWRRACNSQFAIHDCECRELRQLRQLQLDLLGLLCSSARGSTSNFRNSHECLERATRLRRTTESAKVRSSRRRPKKCNSRRQQPQAKIHKQPSTRWNRESIRDSLGVADAVYFSHEWMRDRRLRVAFSGSVTAHHCTTRDAYARLSRSMT